ncbi:MAG: lytic murein transglycosylase [Actinomycetota bacterium]|nr:lytic murein transglycosylase [Actinomycetota bacterium]
MIIAAATASIASGGTPARVADAPVQQFAGAPDSTGTIYGLPDDVPTAPSASPVAGAPTLRPGAAVPPAPSALVSDGIPAIALQAYENAAGIEAKTDPGCGLTWPLLAAIGRVESDHGRANGAVLFTNGVSAPRIIGIALDGHGTSLVRDTDRGRLDGDTVFDHAVGPMQFIPSTWALYGVDGNYDGHLDPFNIFDAAAGAARYLCAVGPVITLVGQTQALRSYNDSDAYLKLVLGVEGLYAKIVPGLVVPTLGGQGLPATPHSRLPPVNPGSASGITPVTALPASSSASVTPGTSTSQALTGSPSSGAPPSRSAPPPAGSAPSASPVLGSSVPASSTPPPSTSASRRGSASPAQSSTPAVSPPGSPASTAHP